MRLRRLQTVTLDKINKKKNGLSILIDSKIKIKYAPRYMRRYISVSSWVGAPSFKGTRHKPGLEIRF